MARIRKEDIFDPKLFTGTTAEIETMISVIKELKNQMTELMKVSKEALKTKPTNTDGIRKQAEEVQKVAMADKNLIALEKERVRLTNRLAQQTSVQAQQNAKLRVQTQERNKQLKQQAREELKLVSIYEKESRTLNNLRKKYKDLVLAGKENSKQARQLAKNIQNLDGRLKKVDASVGQFQRNVGNYSSAFGKLGAGFSSILAAGGVTLGLAGLFRTIRNGVDVVKDFNQSNANLASVLGKVTDAGGTWQSKVKELSEDAKRLGATTVFTAGQVSELQTEFARLGFSQNEILKITASTLDASAALQSDLGEQAALTGAVINAYGLSAEEATRVNDVLTKSTANSALSFQKLQTALPTVAPVANAVGVSLERTTATLGALVDRGIDASTAATGLRNVFLTLSKEGKSLDEALSEIRSANDQAAKGFELFGKRGATIGVVLANTTSDVESLNLKLEQAGGTAQQMAETQLDTLEGSIKLLQSAWQGLIIDVSEAGSSFFSLQRVIKFIADNLRTIAKVVKFATIAFVSYKTAVIATNLAVRAYRAITIGARIATIAFSGGLKGARRAMQLLNTSIKANPIGLLVSGLTTAIALLIDFNSEADDTSDALDRVTEATERLSRAQKEAFDEIDQLTAKSLALIDKELALAKQQGASAEELAKIQEKRLDAEIKGIQTKIKLGEEEIKQLQQASLIDVETEARNQEIRDRLRQGSYNFTADDIENRIKAFEDQIRASQEAAKARLPELEAEIKSVKSLISVKKIENETAKIDLQTSEKQNKEDNTRNKNLKTENIFLKENTKLLKEQRKVRKDLREINRELDLQRYETQAESLLDVARQQASDINFVDPDGDADPLDLVLPNLAEFENQLKLIEFLKQKEARDSRDFQAKELKLQFQDYTTYLDESVEAGKLSDAEAKVLRLTAESNLNTELEILRKEYTQAVEKAEQDRVNAFNDASDEIKATAVATNQSQIKDLKELEDARLSQLQDTLNATNQLLDLFQQQQNRRTQQQLENVDKEIEASKRRFDELKKLSIQGNADAEKSALAEQRRQEELELKKAKIQRRQQLIEAGIAAFKVFASNVERDDQNALGNTIRDITALSAFIAGLPTFIEGAENVGEALGKPQLSGQDGHIVRVDSAERIVDPKNNKKLSGITNDELGDMAYNYKMFDGMKYNKLSNSAFEMMANSMTLNHQLSSQLQTLNRSNNEIISAIKSIPFESWDYDSMSDAVVQKIKNQKKTEIKHFKNNSLH